MNHSPLIELQNISVGFTGRAGNTLPILHEINLTIQPGECVGLVGESGSGKSTLAISIMGYLKHGLRLLNGTARFRGQDMFALSRRQAEEIRGGSLSLIPQNSGASLTPTLRIGTQIKEALRLHSGLPPSQFEIRVLDLLRQVRLPDPEVLINRFPHELSGGQQQRAAIAMALAGEPDALLLDEPTTGLDVTTQAHILELLREIAREKGMAMIYVSHDLGAVSRVCDRVVVLYAGEVLLDGPARQVLTDPAHPYARALLASMPKLSDPRLPVTLEGRPPLPGTEHRGCAFAARCELAQETCRDTPPKLAPEASGQVVRCHFSKEARQMSVSQTGRLAQSIRDEMTNALELHELSISYSQTSLLDKVFGKKSGSPPTVDGISIEIAKGETLGLVGESGSGKSTILKSLAGLLPLASGRITLGTNEELADKVSLRSNDDLRQIQLIFQNPDDSLNPRHTVAQLLEQPLKLYFGLHGEELKQRSIQVLEQVRLGPHYLERLPNQLSGGEKQRVAIARAFAAQPQIVLCDEVTSALDVSVQAAVLELLNDLKKQSETTYIFVSHDLAVVRALSDRVAVLYQGRICEIGLSENVYATPSHPYTEVLLDAVLEPDPVTAPKLTAEDVVELSPPVIGCPFQRRCPRSLGRVCETQMPPWQQPGSGHALRCHIPVADLAKLQATKDEVFTDTPVAQDG